MADIFIISQPFIHLYLGDRMKGFIYKITNKINGKSYIGKTTFSIQKRFQEHLNDSLKERNEKRPLYDAIRKYGKENFFISLVEECDINNLSSREIYWINYYDTFSNGYNATIGGDGAILYDYNIILEDYQKGLLIKDIADKFGCCPETVSHILTVCGEDTSKNHINKLSNKVKAISLKSSKEYYFNSQTEAAKWLKENNYTKAKSINGIVYNIGRTIKGVDNRKAAYGFKWELIK